MTKKTILITGGAGFIGSHVNKVLSEQGYNTIVFDNLARGNQNTVLHGQFINGDLGDVVALNELFKSHAIDAVMHFAAYIDVGESVKNPAKYYINNVSNTLNLLFYMAKFGVNTFIFSSSAAIFGNPIEIPVKEDHPCNPINPYGESKYYIEKILRNYDYAYGLKYCSFRYFNAAGGDPEGKIKNFQLSPTNLIPIVLRNIKNNSAITVNGSDYPTKDGTCVRDYIHVDDLASAHILGMEKLFCGSPSLYYNLGNGHGYSILEVIKAAEKVTGIHLPIIFGERREGDPAILIADSEKAHKELKWNPKYAALETIIEHAWHALDK